MPEQENDMVFYNHLIGKFLIYDTWKLKEGLALLSGVVPDQATINWNANVNNCPTQQGSYVEIVDAVLIEHFRKPLGNGRRPLLKKILEAQGGWRCTEQEILSTQKLISDFMTKHPGSEPANTFELKLAQQVISDHHVKVTDEEFQQIKERLAEYEQVEATLNHYYKVWASGNHPEKRYPPIYYLEWADEKGFNISWWDKYYNCLPSPVSQGNDSQRKVVQGSDGNTIKSLKEIPKRINELEEHSSVIIDQLHKKTFEEVDNIVVEIQAEQSQFLLLDEFSLMKAVEIMVGVPDIGQDRDIKNLPELDKRLLNCTTKFRTALAIAKIAAADGSLKCEIHKISKLIRREENMK